MAGGVWLSEVALRMVGDVDQGVFGDPAPVETGMHLVALLPLGVDGVALSIKPAENGVLARPIHHGV